jgi:hypothetical protein
MTRRLEPNSELCSAPYGGTPKRLAGGGYWEAMEGEMSGWFASHPASRGGLKTVARRTPIADYRTDRPVSG